ncbi:methyltransferase domain-containing protein [Aeromicrobium sp. CTD01-1L150]|uniref:methyltransferase domain-containing protein n=1 Tax=Aeromicrobium sp. CTD01-1L150 TaxID=3341830 RepID=UPI0035BF5328
MSDSTPPSSGPAPVDYDPSTVYDKVTAAWRLLLGDELHYGVFEQGDEPLEVATGELTRRMIAAAGLEGPGGPGPGARVLDVGCGTGAPARRLATSYGVEVVGITTSPVGVDTARTLTERAGVRGVTFEQRDGTDNQLPDESFDLVWVMESSHLMRRRLELVSECARVLRPGGRLVLCDLLRWRDIPFAEVRARRDDFGMLREWFGDAHFESLSWYAEAAEENGFAVDVREDLTDLTLPTFDRWRANAVTHHDEVGELLGEDGRDAFVRSCDVLEAFWRDGTFGYGLLAATKAE